MRIPVLDNKHIVQELGLKPLDLLGRRVLRGPGLGEILGRILGNRELGRDHPLLQALGLKPLQPLPARVARRRCLLLFFVLRMRQDRVRRMRRTCLEFLLITMGLRNNQVAASDARAAGLT